MAQRKLTLGQATGGRPPQVAKPAARRPAAAAPQAAPKRLAPARGNQVPGAPATAPRLGLGLGLGAHQRANLQNAVQSGNANQFLGDRPGLQARMTGANTPNNQFQQPRANFLMTGQSQRPQQPQQARGAPGSDVMPQPPPTQQQPPLNQPTPGQAPGSMGMVGGNMYGQGPPGQQYGQNPNAPNPFAGQTYGSSQDFLNQMQGQMGPLTGGSQFGGQQGGGYGYGGMRGPNPYGGMQPMQGGQMGGQQGGGQQSPFGQYGPGMQSVLQSRLGQMRSQYPGGLNGGQSYQGGFGGPMGNYGGGMGYGY